MQVIGFNFKKILGEKIAKQSGFSMNTNVEFKEINEEKIELLKDSLALKISFLYSNLYTPQENSEKEKKKSEKQEKSEKFGEISCEGEITLSVSKDESKEITKTWKKKQLPNNIRIPLFNLILKKCSPKAVSLADELSLPSPVPLPKISPNQAQQQ